ncbi:chemotaxis protein CheB [Pontibacter mangrovi]|uniref:protein-glutamate methylesterase n=1 Tax=Pontibacter mangrovi TaxID=2589816 RepID=A0A501W387_9BACT|nr:chemotaxis protein CheB [Pontibacter mangrovi]TPE43222.1 response regulator [Pontibacter mangrovi]
MLRVLIAGGSSYARLVLQDIIGAAAGVAIAGLASEREELLKKLKHNGTDLVVLDHDLPGNKNLMALKSIFGEAPAPVLLLLQKEQLTLDLLQQAVALGVYAVVLKPGKSRYYTNYRSIAKEVLRKVMAVRETELYDTQQRLNQLQQEMEPLKSPSPASPKQGAATETIIAIGASTGGTQAVERIVRQLSADLKASVLVALHLPPNFTRTYTKRLQSLTPLKVMEGRTGLKVEVGSVIVAPGGFNMLVQKMSGTNGGLVIRLTDEKAPLYDQPSVNMLMGSVAQCHVQQVIGVILTGMGKDGTAGASCIQEQGGIMIAQNEATSAIFGMAKSAIDSGYINEVLPLDDIPHYLNRLVAGQQQVSTTDRNYEIERTGV